MWPVRRVQNATYFRNARGPSPANPDVIVDDMLSPGSPGAIEMTWEEVPADRLLVSPVTMVLLQKCRPHLLITVQPSQGDMLKALSTTKPTVNEEDLIKLQKLAEYFGQEA